jgi:hypothetical protein
MTVCPSAIAAVAIARPKPEFAPVMKKVFLDIFAFHIVARGLD